MATRKEQIIALLRRRSNLTDREITTLLRSASDNQQPINQACHELAREGRIVRALRADGLIGNRLSAQERRPPLRLVVQEPRP
jgi:hypothetical protein